MNRDKITVILIDDDFVSRNTIKNYLRTSRNYLLADDFSIAALALEWLKKYRADIAICDMKMPNIDGIEFITQALKLCPDLHFLAVSAYSDFRYLRECMINSVDDYLLKHELTADILINTLDKIREKYNMKPVSHFTPLTFHIIEQDVQFNENTIMNLIENGVVSFNTDLVAPIIISPDYNSDLFPNYANFSDNIIFAVKDIICNVLDNKYSYILHINNSFQFALLLSFYEKTAGTVFQNRIKNILLSIKDKVLRLLNITLTTAYSATELKIRDAMELLTCLDSFRETKLYQSPGVTYILGKSENNFSDNYILAPYAKEQMKILIQMKDLPSLRELLRHIYADISKKRISHNKTVELSGKLRDLITAILDLNNDYSHNFIDFHKCEFIDQFEKSIVGLIEAFFRNESGEMNPACSVMVGRALSYIEEHYREDISLERCAEETGISYTHLSRMFKKEMSVSFSEYLKRFRLSRAKVLLAEKKLPIKKIVDETGFTNYNYFFKVFKELEGITPAEYTENANN